MVIIELNDIYILISRIFIFATIQHFFDKVFSCHYFKHLTQIY